MNLGRKKYMICPHCNREQKGNDRTVCMFCKKNLHSNDLKAPGNRHESPEHESSENELREVSFRADAGDIEACYRLGVMYYQGYGCARNLPLAVSYFERAAQADLAEVHRSHGWQHARRSSGSAGNACRSKRAGCACNRRAIDANGPSRQARRSCRSGGLPRKRRRQLYQRTGTRRGRGDDGPVRENTEVGRRYTANVETDPDVCRNGASLSQTFACIGAILAITGERY